MTSIEWLSEIISKMGYVSADIVEQAKEIHKQEIINACHKMQIISKIDFDGNVYFMFSPKDYYKQTFEYANR